MGCFHACFGGDGDRRRGSRRQPPTRPPPRPNHVPVATPVAADVVLREASPTLRGARASRPPSAVEVTDQVVGEASDGALPPSREAKASMPPQPPPAVVAVNDVVTSSNPGKDLRELSEPEASPVSSLLREKKATPPDSPGKCSTMVVGAVCIQDLLKCSPVVAAVASTPDSELRNLRDHERKNSGKKKVTFNMNVTTYENVAAPDQEEGYAEDEGENHGQETVVLPENHRYRNCSDSDDEVGDEYAEDDVYGDSSDEEDEYMDCKFDLMDEEEMSSEENKQESHESLFSLPMDNDQQNDDEVISSAHKRSGTSVEEESPLIKGNNLRSKCIRPVLNPVQNMSEWKEIKSLKTQPIPSKMLEKENVNVVPYVGTSRISNFASQTKVDNSNSSKKEASVDASLSTWLVSSDNSTVDKMQSKSPCSISSVSQDERSGALTIYDLKKSSATSSPQKSPSHNQEGPLILGTVGSYWSCTKQENDHCTSRSDSGANGIPNTTSKYREDRRVNWHSTPFNVRLDRALEKTSA